jgi:hypothetical protein
LRREPRCVLSEGGGGEDKNGKGRRESHRKIVAGRGKLELRRTPFGFAQGSLFRTEGLV